jgi:hypothetical protein
LYRGAASWRGEACNDLFLHHIYLTMSTSDVEYEVEAVVGHRKKNGRKEYLIKWKGYSSDANTWEPEANLNEGALEEARSHHNSQVSSNTARPADHSPSKRPRLDSSRSSGNVQDNVVVTTEQTFPSEENNKVTQAADVPEKDHTSTTKQDGTSCTSGATEVGVVAIKREFETDTDDETPTVITK